jgi:hypothetical protein
MNLVLEDMNRFILLNHQNKGIVYGDTLLHTGWKMVDEDEHADIALVDSDVTPYRLIKLQKFVDRGIKVFVYPHSARPPFFYDYLGYKPFQGVAARFVSAFGHEVVMELMGMDTTNVYPVGWSYCQMRPFSGKQIKNVLFAPLHANGNGWLSDTDKEMNREVQDRLVHTVNQHNLHLLVRYLGQLSGCGLERMPGVDYVQGEHRPESTLLHIDHADLVVGTETFAYMSVARGKPTLMMGEERAPRYGNSESTFRYVQNWDTYKGLVMYPFDILEEDDTFVLMVKATTKSKDVEEWKARMIGEPFDPVTFLEHVESYL